VNTADHVLKLCDFGFARLVNNKPEPLTDYVATRWYRAPELLLGSTKYDKSVDMWAIGCIMGELLEGQPLFPGESEIDQLYILQRVLGPLTSQQMDIFLRNPRFLGFKFPDMSRPETLCKKMGGKHNKKALSLMESLLHINPKDRITAKQAADHPYFAGLKEVYSIDLSSEVPPRPFSGDCDPAAKKATPVKPLHASAHLSPSVISSSSNKGSAIKSNSSSRITSRNSSRASSPPSTPTDNKKFELADNNSYQISESKGDDASITSRGSKRERKRDKSRERRDRESDSEFKSNTGVENKDDKDSLRRNEIPRNPRSSGKSESKRSDESIMKEKATRSISLRSRGSDKVSSSKQMEDDESLIFEGAYGANGYAPGYENAGSDDATYESNTGTKSGSKFGVEKTYSKSSNTKKKQSNPRKSSNVLEAGDESGGLPHLVLLQHFAEPGIVLKANDEEDFQKSEYYVKPIPWFKKT
jgi:serine/threonine protein kinase